MDKLQLCACGCGQAIIPKPHHKYHPPRFLPGHFNQTGQARAYTPSPEEIPSGICECGCGRRTPLAKVTYRDKRHFRGYPIPFLRGHNPKPSGPEHHLWKGGRHTHRHGYIMVYSPEHPNADHYGYVPEHTLVMEEALGRFLQVGEKTHHINLIKADNSKENLIVLNATDHWMVHALIRFFTAFSPAERRRLFKIARVALTHL